MYEVTGALLDLDEKDLCNIISTPEMIIANGKEILRLNVNEED
jgi:hypothetical protein